MTYHQKEGIFYGGCKSGKCRFHQLGKRMALTDTFVRQVSTAARLPATNMQIVWPSIFM